MDFLRNLSESLAVVGKIDPTSQAASTVLSGAINTKLYRRIFAVVQVGALGSSATVNAKFTAAPTSGGSYVDVTGAAITQVDTAGSKIAILELKAETLAALGLGGFVKLSLTVGTAATLTSAVIYGSCARYEPASDNNDASVASVTVA